ncbi:hypothetical protein J6590_081382 [Homalodisca vitripennis]|nr:hypothetical protein J6590_081382 [Homalodisca vitripennis]
MAAKRRSQTCKLHERRTTRSVDDCFREKSEREFPLDGSIVAASARAAISALACEHRTAHMDRSLAVIITY